MEEENQHLRYISLIKAIMQKKKKKKTDKNKINEKNGGHR